MIDGHRVSRVAGGPDGEVRETRTLSERLTIEAEPPPALTVRFEPQGGSSGGEFRLTSGNDRLSRHRGRAHRARAERRQ